MEDEGGGEHGDDGVALPPRHHPLPHHLEAAQDRHWVGQGKQLDSFR